MDIVFCAFDTNAVLILYICNGTVLYTTHRESGERGGRDREEDMGGEEGRGGIAEEGGRRRGREIDRRTDSPRQRQKPRPRQRTDRHTYTYIPAHTHVHPLSTSYLQSPLHALYRMSTDYHQVSTESTIARAAGREHSIRPNSARSD